ncbi:MAG: phosphatase domain-containing protein [Ferruginibacter sp.]
MNINKNSSPYRQSFFKKIKRWFFKSVRLSNSPAVKLYAGFGNNTQCLIYGHALSLSPLGRKKYRDNFLYNSLALLRLFMIKPIPGATVQMKWDGQTYTAVSEKDGFFKFEWAPANKISPGCHTVQVDLIQKKSGNISASSKASLTIPAVNQFAFISDIDDTFLISHSANLRKRMFVLLTENARSRRPFEGAVNHYHLLHTSGSNAANPFFYVSSSEWNLYEYIREFSRQNKLPEGVYLLSQIKKFTEVFKTGHNNHGTKFMRIVRILEAYPNQKFILLGDDTQQDPYIYASIVSHFKENIFCVYIRSLGKNPKPEVEKKLKEIEESGTMSFYFNHSREAIIHSQEIGLIKKEPMVK